MKQSTNRPSTHEQMRRKDEGAKFGLANVDLLQHIQTLHQLIIRLYGDAILPINHDLRHLVGGLSDKDDMIPGYEDPDEAISLGKAVRYTLERDRDATQVILENQEAWLGELRAVGVSTDVIASCEKTLEELREHVRVGQKEAGFMAAAIEEVEEIWGRASTKEKKAYLRGMSRWPGKRKDGWRCGLM